MVLAVVAGLRDLLVLPRQTSTFRTGLLHMGLNLSVALAYLAGSVWRTSLQDLGSVGSRPLIPSAI